MPTLTLSHFEVAPLLRAREQGALEAVASPDLGRTKVPVALAADGVHFADTLLPWPLAERITAERSKCFCIEGAQVEELRVFSPTTGWVRSLFPTGSAPTTVVGGFTMHRIQGIDPLEDTARKLSGIAPVQGRVLDTATGLGYTALQAARTADEVVTVEIDPAAIELARRNPWSSELFTAKNVVQHIADVAERIATFADASFTRVLHDPPSVQLGGDLYSAAFYRQLHRVLAPRGRLSHYVGGPDSPNGARTTRGVIERLRAAGFARVDAAPAAFGVVARR